MSECLGFCSHNRQVNLHGKWTCTSCGEQLALAWTTTAGGYVVASAPLPAGYVQRPRPDLTQKAL